MNQFDVLVIGAGPAGGQCARSLAIKGLQVALIEQHPNFQHNNFSSAGSVLSILEDYDLPDSVVGSYWKRLDIITSKRHFSWSSEVNQGVVLDFAKLRGFLAEDMQHFGGRLYLNHKYLRHRVEQDGVVVTLLDRHNKEEVQFYSRILVDATGPQHSIINELYVPDQPYLTAIGLEYLIQAEEQCHPHDALSFFLGDTWMPEGYAWVFPMKNGVYKVGVATYRNDRVRKTPALAPYLHSLLEKYLHLEKYERLDQHGGVLHYCSPKHEHGYQGRVVAVGDAFSCVNMLGGEGIRHGMHSANLAAEQIALNVGATQPSFKPYRQAILKAFNRDWQRCDRYAKAGYRLGAEGRLDVAFTYLQKMPLSVLVDVLFYYRFGRLKWLLLRRALRKLRYILFRF